jgi:hypothetical protein
LQKQQKKKLRATTQNNQQQHLLGVSVLRARKIKKKLKKPEEFDGFEKIDQLLQ